MTDAAASRPGPLCGAGGRRAGPGRRGGGGGDFKLPAAQRRRGRHESRRGPSRSQQVGPSLNELSTTIEARVSVSGGQVQGLPSLRFSVPQVKTQNRPGGPARGAVALRLSGPRARASESEPTGSGSESESPWAKPQPPNVSR